MCLGDEKMWESSSKYVFHSIFRNTTKHLKIFSFLKNISIINILRLKNILCRTKHSLKGVEVVFLPP